MDPKRKKIYIVVIIVCFLGSILILIWGNTDLLSGTTPPPLHITHNGTTPAKTPNLGLATGDYLTGFNAPAVFPNAKGFNTKVLDSLTFTQLRPFPALTIDGELGRDDPFRRP